MAQFVPLDFQKHGALRILNHPSERFGDAIGTLGVIPREFARLVAHYPIFFRKNAQSERFEPVILLGFHAYENLFLVDELWDAVYVPLHIQRQPFLIAPNPAGDGHVVTLDIESPRVQQAAGMALFHPDGRATSYLENIIGVLRQLSEGTPEAYAYTAKLTEYALIELVRFDLEFADHSKTTLEGLYWVASEKLQSLPGEKLVALRDQGFLPWIYFQLASMAQMPALVARKNRLVCGLATRAPRGSA